MAERLEKAISVDLRGAVEAHLRGEDRASRSPREIRLRVNAARAQLATSVLDAVQTADDFSKETARDPKLQLSIARMLPAHSSGEASSTSTTRSKTSVPPRYEVEKHEEAIRERYTQIEKECRAVGKTDERYLTAQWLLKEVDSRKQKAVSQFYSTLASDQLQRTKFQLETLRKAKESIIESLRTLKSTSDYYQPTKELGSMIEKLIPLLETESRRLTWISKPNASVTAMGARFEFLNHLKSDLVPQLFEQLKKTKAWLSELVAEAQQKKENIIGVLNSLTLAGVAMAAFFAPPAAPFVYHAGVALTGAATLAANRYYYSQLMEVPRGEKTSRSNFEDYVGGFPRDLATSVAAYGGARLGVQASTSTALPFFDSAQKSAMVFDGTMTVAGLLDHISQGGELTTTDVAKRALFSALRGYTFGTMGARFGQIQSSLMHDRELWMLAAVEVFFTSLTSTSFEIAESGWESLNSTRAMQHFVMNAPPLLFGKYLHSKNGSIVRPMGMRDYDYQEFLARAARHRISEADAAEIYIPLDTCSTTGFLMPKKRIAYFQRIAKWASQRTDGPEILSRESPTPKASTGWNAKIDAIKESLRHTAERIEQFGLPVKLNIVYDTDVGGLNALNAAIKKQLTDSEFNYHPFYADILSKRLANKVFQRITGIVRDEMLRIDNKHEPMRTGGDETGGMLLRISLADFARAMNAAEAKIGGYTREAGLDSIPPTKTNRPPGMRIYFGYGALESHGYNLQRTLNQVDRAQEAAKLRKANDLSRKQAASERTKPLFTEKELQQVMAEVEKEMVISPPEIDIHPFASPGEWHDRKILVQLNKLRRSEGDWSVETARDLYGGVPTDPVTGLYDESLRIPTLKRALYDKGKAGDSTTVFWGAMRIENVGGLNELLGHTGANVHLREIATIIRESSQLQEGTIHLFKNTGGKLNLVSFGVSGSQLKQALASARTRVAEYVKSVGLEGVLNPEPGKPDGISLSTGIEEIRADSDPLRTLYYADKALDETPR